MSVTVPVLEPAAAAAPTPASSASGAPDDATGLTASSAEGPRKGSTQRTIGLVVGGAGIVSLGLGAYFGLAAKSTYDGSNADGHCANNQCDGQGLSDRSSASTQATVATVLFGVGLAAVAGGAVLYFTAPRGHTGASFAVSPTPAGMVLSGWW